jgi:hypothetical protein
MQLRLDYINTHIRMLKTPYKVGDTLVDSSFIYELAGEDRSVFIPRLPLFYPDQHNLLQSLLNKDIKFKLDDLDFTRPLFNTIKNDTIINLPTNILFGLEFMLIKYFQESGIHNPFTKEACLLFNTFDISSNNNIVEDSKVVKIKIGRNSVENDIARIKSYHSKDIKTRLDGNRMLSHHQLSQILNEVDSKKIDYIEEPFADLSMWESFEDKNKVGYGIDENLDHFLNGQGITNARALVIKPSLNLSFSGLIKINGLYPYLKKIVSSSFEFNQCYVGLLTAAALFPDEFHGLDTLNKLTLHENDIEFPISTQGTGQNCIKLN